MKKFIVSAILTLACGAALYARPHVAYIYPTGIQRGAKVRLLIGGQYLSGIQGVFISAKGITVRKITQVPGFPHPDGTQRRYLMDCIKRISSGNPTSPAKIKELENWRKNSWWEKLEELPPLELDLVRRNLYIRRNPLQDTPSMRQMVIIDLEASHDAELGEHELVIWSKRGVSAPKIFFVDDVPHQAEGGFIIPTFPKPEIPVITKLPAVLNGQIMPGETDRFRLRLKQGVTYTFTLTGRKFQPFIGDAVPGHFQPILRLVNPVSGRELAFADDEYFNPDPVLRYKAPYSTYVILEVRDWLYRGREDFIYRVAVADSDVPFKLSGKSFVNCGKEFQYSAKNPPLPANGLAVVNGVIAKPGEKHIISVSGKKGDQLSIAVAARKDGSPLDAAVELYDSQKGKPGKLIAASDDTPGILAGPIVQQLDPFISVKLPADGIYYAVIRDLTGKGGKDYSYRMRIGKPQPDFNVYTTTSTALTSPRGSRKIALVAERLENFDGPITIVSPVVVKGKKPAPHISAKADKGAVTIKNPATGHAAPLPLELFAEAVINGKTVRKKVIPADTFNQAFAYDHLLPVKYFYLGTFYVPPRRKPNAKRIHVRNAGKSGKKVLRQQNKKPQQQTPPNAQPVKKAAK